MRISRQRSCATVFLRTVPAVLLTGCASLGDALIWPHQNSNARKYELVCLTATALPKEAAAALLLAPVVEAAAGFIIDQAAKAVERESRRYKATYSSRLSEHLLDRTGQDQAAQRVGGFQLRRFAGVPEAKQCTGGGLPEPVLEFDAAIEISASVDAMRITPTRFVMRKSKAKVSASNGDVQVNVQVTVSAVGQTKDGIVLIDIGRSDFPMGTVNLDKTTERTAAGLAHLASGWYALPAFKQPSQNAKFAPFTLTVTVMEASDLGDVIAKGGTTLAEQRGKLVTELLKALGLQVK